MDYNKAKDFLRRTLEIDKAIAGESNRMTPMLWGGAGVGKSSMVREIAKELGYDLKEIRLSTLSPVDVRGVPWVPGDNPEHFKFVPPAFMPTGKEVWTAEDFKKGKCAEEQVGTRRPSLLFFDEVNTAPPMNQVVAYEISLDRRMGGHDLPEDTLVIMAGNRVQDRGATFEMPLPLANRLVHIEVEPHEDVFLEYGFKKNLPDGLLAFIKFKPNLLNHPPSGNHYAFPTPRSWENAARFVASNGELHEVAAVIGQGAAVELFEFLKLKDSLPDLDKILNTGEEFKHNDISVMYFYCVALSNRLIKRFKEEKPDEQKKMVDNFVGALTNIREELMALALTCMKKEPKIVMYLAKNRKMFTNIRQVL